MSSLISSVSPFSNGLAKSDGQITTRGARQKVSIQRVQNPANVSNGFLALSFLLIIIVPLQSYDEQKVSLIQTPRSVQLSLTASSLIC
jgi:hypothetical protein